MSKFTISGFVGADLLPQMPGSSQESTLKSLRNYIEDRIESHYDAGAHLAIANRGRLHVTAIGITDAAMTTELMKFAEGCVLDFRRTKL